MSCLPEGNTDGAFCTVVLLAVTLLPVTGAGVNVGPDVPVVLPPEAIPLPGASPVSYRWKSKILE
jgi:hypothetical protein